MSTAAASKKATIASAIMKESQRQYDEYAKASKKFMFAAPERAPVKFATNRAVKLRFFLDLVAGVVVAKVGA